MEIPTGGNPEMRLVYLSPELAKEWKPLNKSNRPKSGHHVNKLAKAQTNGEWKLNGDTIKFDTEGNLIDGQHRIEAVIKSGVTIQTYVAFNVPSDTFDTIDQGKSRNLSDVIGRMGMKHRTTVASAVRWLYILKSGEKRGITTRETNAFFYKFLKSNPELIDSVNRLILVKHQGISHPGGMFSALFHLFRQKDEVLAEKFFHAVIVGENLTSDMIEFKLRHVMIKHENSIAFLPNDMLCNLVIKAWNAKRTGKEIKVLKTTTSETRPEIL